MKDFKNVWIFAEAQRGKLSPTALEPQAVNWQMLWAKNYVRYF